MDMKNYKVIVRTAQLTNQKLLLSGCEHIIITCLYIFGVSQIAYSLTNVRTLTFLYNPVFVKSLKSC